MTSNHSLQSTQLNRFLKHFFLIFAALIVLFSLTGGASAMGGGGSGTSGDPFIITNADDLADIGLYLDGYYFILGNDIILTSPWTPLGSDITPFTGNLDGNGYAIFGLTINLIGSNDVGLFSVTQNAFISNLVIEYAVVNAGMRAGTIAGSATNTAFDNIFIYEGNVTGSWYVGGLVGQMNSGSISNSAVTGDITGGSTMGGLAGQMDSGSIYRSYFSGNVTGNSTMGGLAGRFNNSSISHSFATGNVTGSSWNGWDIGGLAGYARNSTVTHSVVVGNITGIFQIGGLVGHMNDGLVDQSHFSGNSTTTSYGPNGGLVGWFTNSTILNSFSTGNITGFSWVGGLVGEMTDSEISNSYVTGNVTASGSMNNGGLVGNINSGVISSSMVLSEFVNGFIVYSDVGGSNVLPVDIFVWENVSNSGGPIASRLSPTYISSEDVWNTFPSNPIWSAFNTANWTLNYHGYFLLPVHTCFIDSELGYAYLFLEALHLIPEYSIIYDGNFHTAGAIPASIRYGFGDETKIKSPADFGLEKTGYTFTGWKTSGGIAYEPGDLRTMTSNVVLFAQWEENEVVSGGTGGGGRGTGSATIVPPENNNETVTPPVGPGTPPPIAPPEDDSSVDAGYAVQPEDGSSWKWYHALLIIGAVIGLFFLILFYRRRKDKEKE